MCSSPSPPFHTRQHLPPKPLTRHSRLPLRSPLTAHNSPMQYYISGTIIFLVIEMLANFAYYRYLNKHGGGASSLVFLFVVAILAAARISLSFFLVLVVSMGLSVVRPSLGSVMTKIHILTALHFVFGGESGSAHWFGNRSNAGMGAESSHVRCWHGRSGFGGGSRFLLISLLLSLTRAHLRAHRLSSSWHSSYHSPSL